MKVAILTAASEDIGYGHLNRCAILAESLSQLDTKVYLVVDGNVSENFIQSSSIEVILKNNIYDLPDANVCIVDLYNYDDEYYNGLKTKYNNIIIFDDDEYYVPESVSGVINTNIYARPSLYPENKINYLGRDYFLLRSEFHNKSRVDNPYNIFVCMGGSDPANQTTRILNLLIQSTKRHIDAVFGHGYKDKNEIYVWEENEQITTHYAKSNLHEIISNAKFSICGAGTMIYELAYMGVPTLSLSLIEYQRIVAESINEHNATLYLGHFNEVSDQEIISQIKRIDNDDELNNILSANSKKLIDDKGAHRLSRAILNCYSA